MANPAPLANLMSVWRVRKDELRGIGELVREARAGSLPGVRRADCHLEVFEVFDTTAALAAMRKPN